jgi:hypothetical protein
MGALLKPTFQAKIQIYRDESKKRGRKRAERSVNNMFVGQRCFDLRYLMMYEK